jgi:hypothetical protein
VRGDLPLDGEGLSQAWSPSNLRRVPGPVRTRRDWADGALHGRRAPSPESSGFKGEVCYSAALTVATALDVACRQELGCLLAQYRASFESRTLRLLPRDYCYLAPLVDGVPSYEGIQDDVDAAPFCESDETLVETASYLVDLDKYARRLEDESRTLFG